MIVYIKELYKEAFIKAGKNKVNREWSDELIERNTFFVEEYNEYIHMNPDTMMQLVSTDIHKSIAKITEINWDKGYIDIRFLKGFSKLKIKKLSAVPIIFYHHYSSQVEVIDRVTKICIEIQEE